MIRIVIGLMLMSCGKLDFTPDKEEPRKEYTAVDTEMFVRGPSRIEYYSDNKKRTITSNGMMLVIVRDTFYSDGSININMYSQSYGNTMNFKIVNRNSNTVLSEGHIKESYHLTGSAKVINTNE